MWRCNSATSWRQTHFRVFGPTKSTKYILITTWHSSYTCTQFLSSHFYRAPSFLPSIIKFFCKKTPFTFGHTVNFTYLLGHLGWAWRCAEPSPMARSLRDAKTNYRFGLLFTLRSVYCHYKSRESRWPGFSKRLQTHCGSELTERDTVGPRTVHQSSAKMLAFVLST